MNLILNEDISNILADTGLSDLWRQFAGKTILITGATGMIPGYLVHTLMAIGNINIIACTRNEEKARKKFFEYVCCPNFKIMVLDISSAIDIKEEVNIIIHGASPSGPHDIRSNPNDCIQANVDGTENLLNFVKYSGAEKFLFLSSSVVYGRPDGFELFDENSTGKIDEKSPMAPYIISKKKGEEICLFYNRRYGINTYIARISQTYGPGYTLNHGSPASDFIGDVINGHDIIMRGSGLVKRNFSYVTDVVTGIFYILLKGEVASPYNVSDMQSYMSTRDFAEEVLNASKNNHITIVTENERNPGRSWNYGINSTRLGKLGWRPRISIQAGLLRTISFFKNIKANQIVSEDIEQILWNDLPWDELRNKTLVVVTGNDLMYAYFVHVLMMLNKQDFNITVIAIATDTLATRRVYGDYSHDKKFHLLFSSDSEPFDANKIRAISPDIYCILFGHRWDTRKVVEGMTQKFLNVNVIDIFNFLELRPKNFLFHSTIAVYGDVTSDNPIREDDIFPFDHLRIPNGMYKESRKLAESICCSMANECNIRVMILRAPSFYGPETDLQSHYPLNDFLYNILNYQDIIINSDGSPRRDFSYFSDVIAGYFYALFKGKNCEVYNLTSTQDISLKELAEIMVSLYPDRHLKAVIKNSPNANDGRTGNNKFLIDINKARELGWEPKVDVKNGIQKTIAYFENISQTDGNL
ncbi:MAG: NAD(P)-dependent oxidoreductase [Bacteroidales bacterium]|jgi:nucleoside-diphosphate-sugar epimerase|nr:NAD(P)-dependent oxidoreductase [Bacteroidales bacterium]